MFPWKVIDLGNGEIKKEETTRKTTRKPKKISKNVNGERTKEENPKKCAMVSQGHQTAAQQSAPARRDRGTVTRIKTVLGILSVEKTIVGHLRTILLYGIMTAAWRT